MFGISDQTALVFANAFEMAVATFMVAIFAVILYQQYLSWEDLKRKFWKMTKLDFQGGPYDVLIALFFLYLGLFIRAETAWEWRFTGWRLDLMRLTLGIGFKVVATLCLIRLFMPLRRYNLISFVIVVVSVAFAFLSTIPN